ncbi:hypothetical protein [Bartonella sp. DGB1]|uniref:hypothetical protein n=1 Tax=Bartonella sp. DGB1 TaxID=3239807 RepID=UPI0035265616
MFPLFLRSESFAASVFGMVISCTAIGGMVAGIIFPKFFKRKYALHLTSFSLFGFSLTILIPGVLAINGFSFQVYFLCLLWGLNGFFYTVTTLVFGTTVQIESPIESIGTITSSISSMQMALLVSGPIMGAMLSELTSISFVFILSGLIGLVFSVYSAVLTFQHRINGVS